MLLRQETAALRDFNSAHYRLGSKLAFSWPMSASAGCGHKATKPYDRVVPKAAVSKVQQRHLPSQ
jgi:hypothetical protein